MSLAIEEGVVGRVGVVFQFAVAPARLAAVVGPFRAVGRGIRLAVEFVAPHQPPGLWRCCDLRACAKQDHGKRAERRAKQTQRIAG